MDPANFTLILAMGAAFCAASISGWLLHMMVSEGLFWVVIASNMTAALVGLFVPRQCSRYSRWLAVPTVNIFCATVLAILVSLGVILIQRLCIEKVPNEMLMNDEFLRTVIAIAGIAMAFSLVFFLVHYMYMQEGAAFRRLSNKVRMATWWAPKAPIVFCDDLAQMCPGECAICLEELATLEDDAPLAASSSDKNESHVGLLKLPCEHVFHGYCAASWMAREVSCPLCRKSIGNLSKCQRICLRPGNEPKNGKEDPEQDVSQNSSFDLEPVTLGRTSEGKEDTEDGLENEVLGDLDELEKGRRIMVQAAHTEVYPF